MVATYALGAYTPGCVGSSPTTDTIINVNQFMKKKLFTSMMFIFIATLALSLVVPSCTNKEDNYNSIEYKQSFLPTASALCNGSLMTRAASTYPNIEKAYFFIRIDNNIPGMGRYASDKYYPQAVMDSYFGLENTGYIVTDYTWASNDLYPRYTYSTKGIDKACIYDYPEESQFMAQCGISKPEHTKFLWYIAKHQDNIWHIDGVLTADTVEDVKDIPKFNIPDKDLPKDMHLDKGNIEVDINKQIHKDWNEIKTSIHIRDCIESMEIIIPIPKNYIVDQDDTAIRTFKYIDNTEVKAAITISHIEGTGIKYYITVDNDYVKSLLNDKTYKDGLTLELHSYTTNTNIDEYLKNTKVTVDPKPYYYVAGQVTTSNWYSDKKDSVVTTTLKQY